MFVHRPAAKQQSRGYFRAFNTLIGIFCLLALLDFNIQSISDLTDALKVGYNFIKESAFYIIDKLFGTEFSTGKPKIDVKIGGPKVQFPWYKTEGDEDIINTGNTVPSLAQGC